MYRAGQPTKLPREGWRYGLQTQSMTVGVCWRGSRDETSRDDATSPPERDDVPLSLSDRIPETHSPPVVPEVLPDLRRSVRERKPPARLNDYVSVVYKT